MKKYYVTICDNLSFWVVEDGKLTDVAHDIWIVEEEDLLDENFEVRDGMEHLKVGDYIFEGNNQKFAIKGIDLEKDVETLDTAHGSLLDIMNSELPVHSTEDIWRHIQDFKKMDGF